MTTNELAVLLNVSQGQIFRHIKNKTEPSFYELDSWKREMRLAEIYLRNNLKNETIEENNDKNK